jgi:hypothetical protein
MLGFIKGGTRYDIVNGRHRVVTDQPIDDGGQDLVVSRLGLEPTTLFAR